MVEKATALKAIRKVSHWINGQIHKSRSNRYGEVVDSATGEQCAEVVMADEADVDAAIQSAQDAFLGWSRTPVLRRARVMFRFKELIERDRKEIAALLTQEHGKVLHDADGSIQRGLEIVEFACGIPHLIKGEYSDHVGIGQHDQVVLRAAQRLNAFAMFRRGSINVLGNRCRADEADGSNSRIS